MNGWPARPRGTSTSKRPSWSLERGKNCVWFAGEAGSASRRATPRRGDSLLSDESDVSGDIEIEESINVHPLKHRRGPGDEEDYETPVRPNDGRKAVKWDRGLKVTAFLDEIEVQPRKYRAGEGAAPRKGCLSGGPNVSFLSI